MQSSKADLSIHKNLTFDKGSILKSLEEKTVNKECIKMEKQSKVPPDRTKINPSLIKVLNINIKQLSNIHVKNLVILPF